MDAASRRDLIGSALIGLLIGLSPHSGSARLIPSIAIGSVAGIGIFVARVLWRRRGRSRGQPDRAPQTPASLHGSLFAQPSPGVWLLLMSLFLVFLPCLVWLYEEYSDSIWRNGHGFFLPLIMAVLIRDRLRKDTNAREDSSALGMVLILVGALLALVDAPIHSGLVAAMGLIITLPGLSLLLLGARRTRMIAFPLSLSVFLMPLPVFLPDTIYLAKASSLIGSEILQIIGVPALLEQTIFTMKSGTFGVSANCSGIPVFYAAILVSLIGASFTSSWPARIGILLCAWPVTVSFNGVRVAILIGLSDHFGDPILDSPIHGLSGIATFWAAIGTLCIIAAVSHRVWRPAE